MGVGLTLYRGFKLATYVRERNTKLAQRLGLPGIQVTGLQTFPPAAGHGELRAIAGRVITIVSRFSILSSLSLPRLSPHLPKKEEIKCPYVRKSVLN